MISVILIALISILWACRELVYHGKFRYHSKFFAKESWVMKYAEPLRPAPYNFYYNTFKIKYKERFLGSATIFVTLSDFLHFAQFLIKIMLVAAVVLYRPWFGWVDVAIFWIVWGVCFTVSYRLLAE